jgi:hypothetical protein
VVLQGTMTTPTSGEPSDEARQSSYRTIYATVGRSEALRTSLPRCTSADTLAGDYVSRYRGVETSGRTTCVTAQQGLLTRPFQ